MEPIKFIDLKPYGKLFGKLSMAYDRVYNSGQYIGGIEVEAFEQEWAEYCGVKYCIGTGNGHDALMLACKYFHLLGEDDFHPSIYIPWKTCLPTWTAAKNGGLSPVPFLEMANEYRIAVHIYGRITLPQNYEKQYLIEDCAQAHGAKLNGIQAGKFGKIAAWSFYPTKNLGAMGDAGAVTTDSEVVYTFISEMKDYGNRFQAGINSRLDPIQAAFLREKLPYLDKWNEQRGDNARAYFDTIVPTGKIKLPYISDKEDQPCWHIFAVELESRQERYALRKFLLDKGIETKVHYPEVPYSTTWKIPEAEQWVDRTLSLPIAPHITQHICAQIAKLINQWQRA